MTGAFSNMTSAQLADDMARILRKFMEAWPGAPDLTAWQAALLIVLWVEGDRRAEPSRERWDMLMEEV